jgi:cholesterol oxidase
MRGLRSYGHSAMEWAHLKHRIGRADRTSIAVDGLELWLNRYAARGRRRGAVLLVHGASANSDTFLVPHGGLAEYLVDAGWEAWTFDWRGSCKVVDPLLKTDPTSSVAAERDLFNLDRVTEHDIPIALREMRAQLGDRVPISVVAHCFGAGAFSIAIARGAVAKFAVQNVVLTTLGLFYRSPWDGWVKAEDLIMERILANTPGCRGITSRSAEQWPPDLASAYASWPRSWLAAGQSPADAMLARLCFMFGQPYDATRLAPGIHGPLLSRLFGTMHLGLYLHAGQMVRRGYAAPLDSAGSADGRYLNPAPFAETRVTLLTGARNRLWHRDSIDLMYEWLLSHAWNGSAALRPTKHIMTEYGHQDLLWGRSAHRDVYPLIARGIDGAV